MNSHKSIVTHKQPYTQEEMSRLTTEMGPTMGNFSTSSFSFFFLPFLLPSLEEP